MMHQSAFTNTNGSNSNGVFSPSLQEFDKADRRGCCGRVRAFCKSRKMQHEQRLSDDRYYEDTYNSFPWSCTFGTDQNDGIWLNRKDQGGILMAVTVWLLIGMLRIRMNVVAYCSNHFSLTHSCHTKLMSSLFGVDSHVIGRTQSLACDYQYCLLYYMFLGTGLARQVHVY